jgi:hypothetical protein
MNFAPESRNSAQSNSALRLPGFAGRNIQDAQFPSPTWTTRPLRRLISLGVLVPVLAFSAGCQTTPPHRTQHVDPNSPTNIAIGTKVIHSNVKHLGINLSGQSFYDSGIMLRDLSFRNPGFEGETWQTILQCKFVQADSCADGDEWSQWPVDFAKGATFEFFYGAAKGEKGIISSSSAPASSAHQGVWLNFGKLTTHPQVGDFYIIHKTMPGNAEGGWRTNTSAGATITTEFQDIASASPGKQALRLNASGPTQSASVTSDIDTLNNRSFVQLNGNYTLSFRAKGLGGSNRLSASIIRLSDKHGNLTYLTREVPLKSVWQDFKFTFACHEDGTFIGPIWVSFSVQGGSALLDDAAFTESGSPDNPTAFRNAVVVRLRELQPGVLRYMDNGTDFGSSLDNLLAAPFARQRSGYSETSKDPGDIPIGLHEFLVLCQAIKTEPWFTMPAGTSTVEMRDLIEYLAAPATQPYGAKRAALGQAAPWTTVFPVIHLELGNEIWNQGTFPGEAIPDPKAYATRVSEIFAAARSAPLYNAAKFDLIMGGWTVVPWYSEEELSVNTHADTLVIGPYTFNPFVDASTPEAIFGPMFAEPEAMDSRPTGIVVKNTDLAAKHGVKLAIYEVNLGTTQGKASQQALESTVPSLGAGLSVADHMLLMLRDDGILTQALFALPEYSNGFTNTDHPNQGESMKLWGTVVDMGGQTNRVRPTFLAEELANSAIADKMIETVLSGANPTWDQPQSPNAETKLTAGAHLIQSFAFTDGKRCNLVLFNLSRTNALPVTLSGPAAPVHVSSPQTNHPGHPAIQVSRLTSSNISDSNEFAQKVDIKHETLQDFDPTAPYSLPPFSMTVLSWDVSGTDFKNARP